MRRLHLLGCAVVLGMLIVVQAPAYAELATISDGDLGGVTGQEGAALEFDFRINETSPTPTTPDPATGPTNIAGCGAPTTTGTADACRLALQFANRAGNGGTIPQQWLVIKDAFGRLFIPNLYIDAATTPGSGWTPSTSQSTVVGTTGTITQAATLTNLAIFKDPSGNCQLNCQGTTTPNPYNMPALQISMKNSGGATYLNDNVANDESTFANAISLFLNIGGMSVEYGANGPTNNTTGSFQAINVGDITSSPVAPYYSGAKISYSGRVLVYGF